MQPVLDEFISENQDLEYVRIDIDKNPALFKEYTFNQPIMSVPTFFAMSGDEIIKIKSGSTTKDGLAALFL
jgi:hypothetical protein